jgi:energy-coupling factor transporter transmembrane protein EcfT
MGPVVSSINNGLRLIIPQWVHIIRFRMTQSVFQIDPRFSIVALVAIGATGLFVLSSAPAMSVLLGYLLLLFSLNGGGIRTIGRLILRSVPILALILLLNAILVPGQPLVSIGGRELLTVEGFGAGLFFSLRFLVLYLTAIVFLELTPPVEFARGVYTILRPASAKLANQAAFYGFLVLSFLPLFADEFERIRIAQSFRGAEFKGGILRRVFAVRLIVVPLVLSAIHRSEQVAAVVELRGVRDRIGLGLGSTRPTILDFVFSLVTAVVILVAVALLDS